MTFDILGYIDLQLLVQYRVENRYTRSMFVYPISKFWNFDIGDLENLTTISKFVTFNIGHLRYWRSLDLTSIYNIEVFNIEGDLDIWVARIQMRDSAIGAWESLTAAVGQDLGRPGTAIKDQSYQYSKSSAHLQSDRGRAAAGQGRRRTTK
jgi:hypothetical protein